MADEIKDQDIPTISEEPDDKSTEVSVSSEPREEKITEPELETPDAPEPQAPNPKPRQSKKPFIVLLVLLLILGAVGAWWWVKYYSKKATAPATSQSATAPSTHTNDFGGCNCFT